MQMEFVVFINLIYIYKTLRRNHNGETLHR